MKQKIFNYILLSWMVILTGYTALESGKAPPDAEFELKLNDREIMKDLEANVTNMLAVCEYYGVKHPRVVTAQAILESGNFESKLFKEYNNPFGLYNSKEKDYFKFKHWTDAIAAYISMVEYRYVGGDYYRFLEELPYAQDNRYIDKVRIIESNLPP